MIKIKQWVRQHERLLSLGALVAGFAVDNLTLARADLPLVNVTLVAYLGLMGFSIFLLQLPGQGKVFTAIKLWVPLIIQFLVGNLFSGFFVLYFHSAALSVSWPFLFLLLVVFLGSEFGKKHYERFGIQLSVWYLGILSFLIFHLPVVLGEMSARVFILGGLVSLAVMFVFVFIIWLVAPRLIWQTRHWLAAAIGSIFLIVNIFYFTGVLPPIPLLLKDVGVYHQVQKVSSGFVVTGEPEPWYRAWWRASTIHLPPGHPVYVFSAVFAPIALKTGIVHLWEYYDEEDRVWRLSGRISLSLSGGRDGGYRSYSIKSSPKPGWWRVSITTANGQVIGREKFKIESAAVVPVLQSETL